MSENISSASQTVATQLTDSNASSFFTITPKEFFQCTVFNFKVIFMICLAILILSLLMSCINSLLPTPTPTPSFDDETDTISYEHPIMMQIGCKSSGGRCKCNKIQENFSNDEMYSYKSSKVSNYQSVPLLAPQDEFKNPTNLFFGQANRHIFSHDDILNYRLEIYADLLVLGGNVYDVNTTVNQTYKVYLLNDKTNQKLFVDNLYKDGDGVYKLKYNTNTTVEELLKYNNIVIVYSLNGNEQILLQGTFN